MSIFSYIFLFVRIILIKLKYKWLLGMVSRYAFNIFKEYKENMDFKIISKLKRGVVNSNNILSFKKPLIQTFSNTFFRLSINFFVTSRFQIHYKMLCMLLQTHSF